MPSWLVGPLLARLQPCESWCGQGGEQQCRGPKSSSTPIRSDNSSNSTQHAHTPTRTEQRITRDDLPRLLTCLRAEKWLKSGYFLFLDQSHTAAPKISCISVETTVRRRGVAKSRRQYFATVRSSWEVFKRKIVPQKLLQNIYIMSLKRYKGSLPSRS